MLSFSTKGSAKHEVVDKVVEATKLAKEMDPELKIDGELQADAALVPSVGEKKVQAAKSLVRQTCLYIHASRWATSLTRWCSVLVAPRLSAQCSRVSHAQ